jgi:hypothetical protein
LFLPLIALAQYNVPGSLVTPCCVTVANGGTGASSTTGAFSALAPSPTRAGDVIYWNGSNWVTLAGNNSGTQLLQETSSGVPSWVTGAAGTVSSFSAGNLSPLFTSSVATATSTPALTFSLTNAGATTLFGNLTGSSAAPSYTATSTIPLSDFGLGIGLTGYLYGNGSSAITASSARWCGHDHGWNLRDDRRIHSNHRAYRDAPGRARTSAHGRHDQYGGVAGDDCWAR